jgi:glutamine amidotransferase
MITIIDYQVGNLVSIQNMLNRIGYPDAIISSNCEDIGRAEKLILPGVGHFDYGMEHLRKASFWEILNQKVMIEKIPILGICLGAQLLLQQSEEGNLPGLGWIEGKSRRFDEKILPQGYKIPHMGWSEVRPLKESKLLTDLTVEQRFYFVHSYYMECLNPRHHLLESVYGYPFIAAVEKDNIVGVQFHPEKSHKYGMAILKNFITYY